MTALTHAQARQWIEQAADGLLNSAQQNQLAIHLKGCADCRAFAAELASLENEIGKTLKAHWGQPSLSKSGHQKVLENLQKQVGQGSGSPPWIEYLVLATAALLTLLVIGYIVFSSVGKPAISAATESATASATAPVTATSTATPVPAAQLILVAVPTQNVNCREGNSSQFEIADTLQEGNQYTPIGRGRDNMWVLFDGPSFGTKCWAYIQNLALLVNDDPVAIEEVSEELLPFVAYPPTPTPTPTPTFTPEPFTPECSDGIDNDGDRRIDLNDTSCSNASDNDESN